MKVGRGGVAAGKIGGVDILEVFGVKQAVDIEQDQDFVANASKTFNRSACGARNHVWGWLDRISRNPQHTGDRIHGASHRAVANIQHDRPRLGIDLASFQAEEHPQVDDRNDRSPQIADAFDIVGNLGNPCDATGDHDFLDPFNAKDVPLASEFETDKLPGRAAGLCVGLWMVRGVVHAGD